MTPTTLAAVASPRPTTNELNELEFLRVFVAYLEARLEKAGADIAGLEGQIDLLHRAGRFGA